MAEVFFFHPVSSSLSDFQAQILVLLILPSFREFPRRTDTADDTLYSEDTQTYLKVQCTLSLPPKKNY